MIILTGNDLKSGYVVWWDGEAWSPYVEEAVDVGEDADAIIARESAAQRVNAAYAIEASASDDGPRPAHIKDRVRALGPTVRMDLSLKPNDPGAAERVI